MSEFTEKEVIDLMKKLGADHITFEFNCGGDNMGDTEILIKDENGDDIERTKKNEVDIDTIVNFIDNEVYNNVEFYVNSDGHYMGESGYVQIEIEDFDGELSLAYSKHSQSEWSESIAEDVLIEVSEEERAFIEEFVEDFNGSDGDCNTNFKKDFIMTDKQEAMLKGLEDRILEKLGGYEPECEGELQDYFNFETENDIQFIGNCLVIKGIFYETVLRDE